MAKHLYHKFRFITIHGLLSSERSHFTVTGWILINHLLRRSSRRSREVECVSESLWSSQDQIRFFFLLLCPPLIVKYSFSNCAWVESVETLKTEMVNNMQILWPLTCRPSWEGDVNKRHFWSGHLKIRLFFDKAYEAKHLHLATFTLFNKNIFKPCSDLENVFWNLCFSCWSVFRLF